MESNSEIPRVGVLGCGRWGKNLVRNFDALGALRAICDPRVGAMAACACGPDVRHCGSLDELLASGVDAVVVATPAATHFDAAWQCLSAGKDVFVEKPLSLTMEQGYRLVRRARETGRMLLVGHVLEYHPAIKALNRLAHGGDLGRIRYIYSHRLSLGTIRGEENILWSFAPHDIAVILRLAGSDPIEVSACGGAYLQPNIPDVTVTNLLFDQGVRAHIHVSWLHPFKEQRLVVIGSKRMASFDDVAKKLVLYDQRVDFVGGEPAIVKGEGTEVAFDPGEPLRLECQAFLDAIVTRTPPLTGGESGLAVLRVLDASQRSMARNGALVATAERLVSV